jgi:5-methylcytosine-specific restriction protein A
MCHAAGRVVLATQRDHVVPLAEGGRDDDSNIQPLCEDCHRSKTQREAARARGRNATGTSRRETAGIGSEGLTWA